MLGLRVNDGKLSVQCSALEMFERGPHAYALPCQLQAIKQRVCSIAFSTSTLCVTPYLAWFHCRRS
jgi:hypothetical protein